MNDGRGGQITGIAGKARFGRANIFLNRSRGAHGSRETIAPLPPDAIPLRRSAPLDPWRAAFGGRWRASLCHGLYPVACIGASWQG